MPLFGGIAAAPYANSVGQAIFGVFAGAAQLMGMSLALFGTAKYAQEKKFRDDRARVALVPLGRGIGLSGQF